MNNELCSFDINASDDLYNELYKKLWKQRILYFNNEIDDNTIDYIAMPIILQNMEEANISEKELKPITIYLNTYGGSIDACLYLIDIIQKSRIPIHVRVLSIAASAGLYITLACKYRTASENSVLLLHKGSYSMGGNAAAVEDAMDFYKGEVDDKIVKLILEKTKLTPEQLTKIRRNELYVLGQEAKDVYGFLDEII